MAGTILAYIQIRMADLQTGGRRRRMAFPVYV